MSKRLSRFCDSCKKYGEVELTESLEKILCPSCQCCWGSLVPGKNIFEACPICQCRQFYTAKDFNQFMGCLVILLGVVFVPVTYGLSLPAFALIDWFLYRRTPSLICCYRCACELRGFDPAPFKPFMHHIGLKYDKYR